MTKNFKYVIVGLLIVLISLTGYSGKDDGIEDENKGLKGVAIKDGKELIFAEYAEKDFETIHIDENELEIFVVIKPDGYIDVLVHDDVNTNTIKMKMK